MATRTWISNSSTNANLASNYDGSGSLLSTDDLVVGTGTAVWTMTADLTVKSLTISASREVTVTTYNLGIQNLTLGLSSTLTLGLLGSISISSSLTLGSGYTIKMGSQSTIYYYASTLPNVSITSTVGSTSAGIYLIGNVTASGITMQQGYATGIVLTGNGSAGPSLGNGSYVCDNFYITNDYGSGVINLMTSTITASNLWEDTYSSDITHVSDTVKITDTASIVSAHNFNYLVIDAPGKTVTLNSNVTCHGYNLIAGTLNLNGRKLRVLNDCVIASDVSPE